MEIVVNTENKTVKVVGQATLQELINTMTKMGLGLSEYSIIGTETLWQFYPYTNPYTPWEVTCTDNPNGAGITYNTEPKIS